MKVILTGPTGSIGSAVLTALLNDPRITTIYALTRRPLPSPSSDPRLVSIIHSDFLSYPPSLLDQLVGAQACFWTIGTTNTAEYSRTVDVEYSQAAAKAFEQHLQPRILGGGRFRFVHVSGFLAEKDQGRSLWFIEGARKSRGQSETSMLEFGSAHPDTFAAYVVRAGGVLASTSPVGSIAEWALPWACIRADTLALAMIEIADQDGESGITENRVLIEIGGKARVKKMD